MGPLKHSWIWLKRFGHRRGYGVHSPFAFSFITDVIYGKGNYYAYEALKRRYPLTWRATCHQRMKHRKLAFRLANYVHPQAIHIYGYVGADVMDYMQMACEHATMRVATDQREVLSLNRTHEDETILTIAGWGIPPEHWEEIVKLASHDTSACLITGIHTNKKACTYWTHIKNMKEVVVTFDLYSYGIIFFDKEKQKQHYIVNF